MGSESKKSQTHPAGPYHFLAVIVAGAAALGLRPSPVPPPGSADDGAHGVSTETLPAVTQASSEIAASEKKTTQTQPIENAARSAGDDPVTGSEGSKGEPGDVDEAIRMNGGMAPLGKYQRLDPLRVFAPPKVVGNGGNLEQYLLGERKMLNEIRRAQRALAEVVTELWSARGIRRRATRSLDSCAGRCAAQRARVEKKAERLATRYRALYKMADGWSIRPRVGGSIESVPLDGRMELAYALDREMSELGSERKALEALESECRRKTSIVEEAKSRVVLLDKRRDGLEAAVARLHQHLRDLRRRKEDRNRAGEVWNRKLKRLNRSVRDLASLVEDEGRSFLSLKGDLPRPVPGMIIRRFGTDRVKGTRVTVTRRGIEISALRGWKARSPARGAVRYAGPVAGFHNVVIIDHGEGFLSVVGNLGRLEVQPGDRIGRGKPLGYVHTDPDCRKWDCVSCYYELRRGAVALNPHHWFRSGTRKRRRQNDDPAPSTARSAPASVAER